MDKGPWGLDPGVWGDVRPLSVETIPFSFHCKIEGTQIRERDQTIHKQTNSLQRTVVSIVESRAQGRPCANRRRVSNFEALTCPTFALYCQKQGSRPSTCKPSQSDDMFKNPCFSDRCFVS